MESQEQRIADQKVKEEMSDNQQRVEFAKSYGWALVKKTLIERMVALDSASATVESMKRKRKSFDEITRTLYTNGIAVGIITDWINEVEVLGGLLEADFKADIADRKAERVIVQLPD